MIAIINKRDLYRSDHPSGASFEQFLSFVLDKAILNLIELRNALKRGKGIIKESLDREIEDENGDPYLFSETVSEEKRIGGRRPGSFEHSDFRYDTERMFRRLNKEQREIGSLIIKGYTPSEITRLIKKPRTTLHTEIRRLGNLLLQEGFRDYFGESIDTSEKFPANPVEDK